MTARQIAIQDIKDDLKAENRCFLAFHKELNPVMHSLVKEQLQRQGYEPKMRNKTQLVAHCLFSYATGEVKLNNYSKYYE